MRNVLLDTGALVALLDKSEQNHESCLKFLKEFRGQLVTTEPVLTEAVYLLGPLVKAQKACIDFILRGGATLVPQFALLAVEISTLPCDASFFLLRTLNNSFSSR